jgi:hypothetical protein
MPREQFALARSADPGSPEPGLVWIVFLAFFSSLPFVAALADVTKGTITSAVAYMANVKSRVADLLMRLPPDVVGASLISRFPMGLLWSRRGKCAPVDHVKATHSNSVTAGTKRKWRAFLLESLLLQLSPISTSRRYFSLRPSKRSMACRSRTTTSSLFKASSERMSLIASARRRLAPSFISTRERRSIASFRLAVSLALKSIGSTIMKSLYFGLDLSPVSTKLRMAHFS